METNVKLKSGLTSPLNRVGYCPGEECEENWDGGDILDQLSKLDIFANMSLRDLETLAEQAYGYTRQNSKHFSKATAIRVVGKSIYAYPLRSETMVQEPHFYQCPACKQLFDVITGQSFSTIMSAKQYFYDQHSKELSKDSQKQESL